MIEELESPKKLADRLGWPVSRVRNLVTTKQLRHFRLGKSIMIPVDAVQELMSRSEVTPEIMEAKNSNETVKLVTLRRTSE